MRVLDLHAQRWLACTLMAIALTGGICGTAFAVEELQPTTMVVRGKIWTGDAARPWAEAVAVRGDTIVAVGSREEIAPLVDAKTQVIEAGDGLVVPGLIDSHVHLVDGGLNLENVQLRDAKTRDEFVRRIGERAAALEDGEWILGGDWDHTLWGGELPDRKWIDKVTPNNPVWIHRVDGHMALANTAAMEEAGVEDDVKNVEGGEIVRDRKASADRHLQGRCDGAHRRIGARGDARGAIGGHGQRDGLPGRARRDGRASHGFVGTSRHIPPGPSPRTVEDADLRVRSARAVAATGAGSEVVGPRRRVAENRRAEGLRRWLARFADGRVLRTVRRSAGRDAAYS